MRYLHNTPAEGKRLSALIEGMVLLGRIELPTSPLPRVRSTTELQQRRKARAIGVRRYYVKQSLSHKANSGKALRMHEDRQPTTREERLAAKLRENLRRRKAQARAMETREGEPLSKEDPPR